MLKYDILYVLREFTTQNCKPALMRQSMKDYLSIGKVSKLKGVSIKSLRYYDEIGILKPAYVNQATNYRYYKPEQLFLIDAITLCIELGIPLKTLPDYQAPDKSWDFQRLLFDGKTLAEDKIRSMRNSINALQNTLRMIESGEMAVCYDSTPPAAPKSASQEEEAVRLPKGTYKISAPKRLLLTVPFDIATSTEHYNHKLLELFVGANQTGLTAAYPAGLYYEQKENVLSRFVFVHLEGDLHTLPPDSPFFIKKLPDAEYLCSKNATHQIENAQSLFAPLFIPNQDYLLLEQAITDDGTKETVFELQYLPRL